MFLTIGAAAAIKTFSTPPLRNCAGQHVEENSSRRICLLKLIFLHFQLHLVILYQPVVK